MNLSIDIDIENCRRKLGDLEDLSRGTVATYQRIAESIYKYAPSWRGEDRDAFAEKIEGFNAVLDGIRRNLGRSVGTLENCLYRAERIEALWD